MIGLLAPRQHPDLVAQFAGRRVTAIGLDGLPRTISRAKSTDVLSSQANIAGYKAAVLAADTFGGFFPMLITAAGNTKPADVLVLGAAVAGLSAMGTARRLRASVTGYDVRPRAREEIVSLGARCLRLTSVQAATGEGGYARALTADGQAVQQTELDSHISRFDVVITTAQVQGKPPPLLVNLGALDAMRPGPVIVDLAAGAFGGNVHGSRIDAVVHTDKGVTIIGAGNLPARMPTVASTAYSHNTTALLTALTREGALTIDPGDDIQAGVLITHQRTVFHSGSVSHCLGDPAAGDGVAMQKAPA